MQFKKRVHLIRYWLKARFHPKLVAQRKNPFLIPVIIINFNQLASLQNMVKTLKNFGFQRIIVVDNASTYPPLLEYYEKNTDHITIVHMPQNLGHKVFFNSPELIRTYASGYYFLTDPDIILNKELPSDFPFTMLRLLDQYFLQITKVGFALKVDNLPSTLRNRESIYEIEQSYYAEELQENVYRAETDTTFALYKPGYPLENYNAGFYKSVRVAGGFTAVHEGWYVDTENMTPEQKFYYSLSDPAVHSTK